MNAICVPTDLLISQQRRAKVAPCLRGNEPGAFQQQMPTRLLISTHFNRRLVLHSGIGQYMTRTAVSKHHSRLAPARPSGPRQHAIPHPVLAVSFPAATQWPDRPQQNILGSTHARHDFSMLGSKKLLPGHRAQSTVEGGRRCVPMLSSPPIGPNQEKAMVRERPGEIELGSPAS